MAAAADLVFEGTFAGAARGGRAGRVSARAVGE
jgi:hypothetical protein